MKKISLLILLPAFLVACDSNSPEVPEIAIIADTVLTNGKIYTMNPEKPWSEAVAIKGGKYIFVGDSTGAFAYVGEDTQVIDLEGRMSMPGINDAHMHPVMGAVQSLYHCRFPIPSGPDEIAQALRGCIEKNPQAEWIVGGQWGSGFFQKYEIESPREWLDAVTGDIAVTLHDDSLHNAWFNSKALAIADISAATPDPDGGVIGRDADGEPNGLLFETAARLGQKAVPDWSSEQYVAAVKEVLQLAAGFGITGFKDAGAHETAINAFHQVDQREGLSAHVATSIRTPYVHRTEPLDTSEIERIRASYVSPHLHTEFVKIFLDGVPTPARTAAMLDPYLADETHGDLFTGNLHVEPPALAQDLITLDAMGLTVKMHAAGDRSVRVGLDAIEAAREANGSSGLRHELAHAGFIHPDDVPRFEALNAVADISPILWHPSPIIQAIVSALGHRGELYFPVRDLLDSGARIAAGTDWPAVSPSANPWPGIEALVSRRDPTGQTQGELWAEQAITLEEALRIYTINGARALRLDEMTGSIEAGKSADLIVLDRKLFEIPVDDVGETEILMTFFEGQLVFSSEG